jgi:hypothetical protein
MILTWKTNPTLKSVIVKEKKKLIEMTTLILYDKNVTYNILNESHMALINWFDIIYQKKI